MSVPGLPSPRKSKPRAFSRPSVMIQGEIRAKRSWRRSTASLVVVGDTVPGVGVVSEVRYFEDTGETRIRGGNDNERWFARDEEVMAFKR